MNAKYWKQMINFSTATFNKKAVMVCSVDGYGQEATYFIIITTLSLVYGFCLENSARNLSFQKNI
jgi:hypothetical protein